MLGSVSLKLLFVVFALVCFALAFFNIPRYNWTAGGFFFVTLAIFA